MKDRWTNDSNIKAPIAFGCYEKEMYIRVRGKIAIAYEQLQLQLVSRQPSTLWEFNNVSLETGDGEPKLIKNNKFKFYEYVLLGLVCLSVNIVFSQSFKMRYLGKTVIINPVLKIEWCDTLLNIKTCKNKTKYAFSRYFDAKELLKVAQKENSFVKQRGYNQNAIA